MLFKEALKYIEPLGLFVISSVQQISPEVGLDVIYPPGGREFDLRKWLPFA